MLRALPALLTIISSLSGAGAGAMGGRGSEPPADTPVEAEARPDPQYRPGPYVYQHATDLDLCFWLYGINNPGQTLTCGGGWSATATTELKLPDADDPSLIWYMPEGPIRFYLPAREAGNLSQSRWRYKACHYKIVNVSSGKVREERLPDFVPTAKAFSMLVESRCDDIPGKAVLYLFDFRMGLLSFTLGKLARTESGDKIFQAKETYHLIGYVSGFGQPAPVNE